jgi:hypothetical protein
MLIVRAGASVPSGKHYTFQYPKENKSLGVRLCQAARASGDVCSHNATMVKANKKSARTADALFIFNRLPLIIECR